MQCAVFMQKVWKDKNNNKSNSCSLLSGKIFVGEKWRNFFQVTENFPRRKFSPTKIFPDEVFPDKVCIFILTMV